MEVGGNVTEASYIALFLQSLPWYYLEDNIRNTKENIKVAHTLIFGPCWLSSCSLGRLLQIF